MKALFRNAILIALAASLIGAIFNALRPSGLDWVAGSDYQILVPCPEPMGDAAPLPLAEAKDAKAPDALIDARDPEAYSKGHLSGAQNIPYDFLSPVSRQDVERLVAARFRRVIVYGSGDEPDTGKLLAGELAAAGIKNVFFIEGGMQENPGGGHGN